MQTQFVRPDRTKLFGVTHSMEGTPLRRQTRSLKIGIGVIKGKDINVWINKDGTWVIEVGIYKDGKRTPGGSRTTYATAREAEMAYIELSAKAPERKYPGKLPFFTFLHPNEDGTGFVHDFPAIEAHGPMPTELDIFFTTDTPFAASYEWWASNKLKCWGDGQNALRKIDLARTAEEKELAKNPIDGDRFPIIGGCAEGGCPYCQEDDKGKRECKPHGKLLLQLSNSPSIGSTCTFDTTGYRSTQQIGSSLTDLLETTGQGDPTNGHLAGIPLKLILRPYIAYPNGKATKLYAVNVEFKPKNQKEAEQITQAMLRYANAYRSIPALAAAASAPQQLLEAPTAGWSDEDEADEAEIMEAEFYPERKEGSQEAAAEVIEAKKEELRQRGAKVTEIPKTEPKPASKMPVSLEMAKEFKKIKTDLNKETGNDELYYRVLNGAGYQKSNEVPTVDEGKRVYKLLLAELRAILAAKPAPEPTVEPEQSDAAEPEEVASTLDPEELDAREGWLPENMQKPVEPKHLSELRLLEVQMKERAMGGRYRDILGENGAERTEDVTEKMFPEVKRQLGLAIASKPAPTPPSGRIKL